MQEKVVIEDIKSRPILDSRDEWTIETEIFFSDGSSGIASTPSGKSTGSREAKIVSVKDAIASIHGSLKKNLRGFSANDQIKFDKRLIDIDGTIDKRNIGANTILSLSISFLKALAHSNRVETWRLIRELCGNSGSNKARLLINVINGGVHSGSNLPFQEYIVIPKSETYRDAVSMGQKIYHSLSNIIKENLGPGAVCIGDEGGFAPTFRDPLEPFSLIRLACEREGLYDKVDFGMDSANGAGRLGKEEMKMWYGKFVSEFNLHYLEDPFGEDMVDDFVSIKNEFPNTIIAGDDLTTTNAQMIEKMAGRGAINGVIIKPNQIGTVYESLEAIKIARKNNVKIIVSHRSGETNDDFIADFAHGTGAYGFKLGSPARGERVSKYNRLLRIEG